MIKKYRSKQIVIEVLKWTGSDNSYNNLKKFGVFDKATYTGNNRIRFVTSVGIMFASPGDYIVKGVNGEFWPVKPDIFKLTYEEVEE